MKKKVLETMALVAALVAMSMTGVACGENQQEGTETQQTEDKVIMQSFEVSPDIKVARLTCSVETDKKQEVVEKSYADYIPQSIFSLYELADIKAEDNGYTLVYDGIYDDASKKAEEKDSDIIETKHFDASDGEGLELPVDVSKLGVCIEPEEEWQNDNCKVYVIADLKDGTSRYITQLPAINPSGKSKYKIDPPEEVEKIMDQESDVYPEFVAWGAATELPNCGVRIATRADVDVEQIEGVRLIVQSLEEK